ncbi:Ig-like domain-containing protein [Leptospira sp. 201903071]|uniref:Ig-like domain-containing protein n=1 Tax=Leptospira ainazelensis TaxID=2810034 RepID=UPI0019636F10|nr:Ig-like domain-containing protein [Leptospira ainazelensis]MBM9500132.1 Ig-like domain-containing protein [Leptospira ainazelensis]
MKPFLSLPMILVLSFFSFVDCLDRGSNNLPPIFSYIDLKSGTPTVPFGVSQISPGSSVSGVTLNTSIQIGFNRNLDSSTINSSTFRLVQGSTPIPGSFSLTNAGVVFTPSSSLASTTVYTVTLTKEVKAADGSSLGDDFSWNFTTSSTVDTTAPIVSLTTPLVSAVSVPVNTSVSVAFSETMNCASLNTTSFQLNNGAVVAGTVSCSGSTATFTPSAALAFNTSYTATISVGAQDLAGNPIASAFSWNFTTGSAPDSTPPTVSFVNPLNSSVGFAINGSLAVAFSETLNCTTLTTASFVLSDGSAVAGTVSCLGTTASFNPTAALSYNTNYTATITTFVKDLSGNSLAAPFSWSFTTGSAPDSTPPTVSLVSPSNSLSGVAVNTSVSAVFSEFVDCTTLTTASFTLNGGSAVAGTVSCLGTSATFTPSAVLSYNTAYTATITTALRDLAGNSIAATYNWSFTTGAAPDSTPPTVSVTNPLNSSVGFSVNGVINVAFSETLNCGSVTAASFTLNDGSAVAGTVGCSSTTATFTPISTLSYNTSYTATITTAVQDLAGNSIAASYIWSFTTGSAPDVTAPTVSIVNPIASSGGVATNTTITAAFSEGMDCTSLTTATFTLNNGAAVAGTVSCSGTNAVFTPSAGLLPGTSYTATILIGAKDLANNSIVSNYNWSFTTGALPDTTSPSVSIQNLMNKSLLETGFVIGTASDASAVSLVEVSIDGGAYTTASGTTTWNFKLPSGAATWTTGSQHTISVRSTDASGNVSTITSAQVRKGTNKDVNGDGYVDLISGEYGQGLVYIFHSSGTGGITATNASLANRYIVGSVTEEFGRTVTLGDLNGDGYADVIVGAPAANAFAGRVYAFYSSGSAGVNISFVAFASARIDGVAAGEKFGAAIDTGDVDGNGYADLIVGAPNSTTSRGRVYIFHSAGAGGIVDSSATTAACTLTGTASNDLFGNSVASGNINGDIYADVAIGSYGYNGQRGRVYIYHGSSTGLGAISTTLSNGTGVVGDQFGFSIAVADVSGDGYSDLIASAPFLNSGRGHLVIYSSSATSAGISTFTGLGAATYIIQGVTVDDHFGYSLKARDLDNDGRADIIANSTPNSPAQGLVSIFMTPLVGFTNAGTASLTMTGPLNDLYGWGLATGDINGDGYADLLVGSPGYNNGTFQGRVYIFHSSGTGLTTNLPASASRIIDGSGLNGGTGNWFGINSY